MDYLKMTFPDPVSVSVPDLAAARKFLNKNLPERIDSKIGAVKAIISSDKVSFTVPGTGGGNFKATRVAFLNYCGLLERSFKPFAPNIPFDMLQEIIVKLVGLKAEEPISLFVRDGIVLNVMLGTYRIIPSAYLLDQFEEENSQLKNPYTIEQLFISDYAIHLAASFDSGTNIDIWNKFMPKAKKGTDIEKYGVSVPGVQISNSDVGLFHPVAKTMIFKRVDLSAIVLPKAFSTVWAFMNRRSNEHQIADHFLHNVLGMHVHAESMARRFVTARHTYLTNKKLISVFEACKRTVGESVAYAVTQIQDEELKELRNTKRASDMKRNSNPDIRVEEPLSHADIYTVMDSLSKTANDYITPERDYLQQMAGALLEDNRLIED